MVNNWFIVEKTLFSAQSSLTSLVIVSSSCIFALLVIDFLCETGKNCNGGWFVISLLALFLK